MTMQWSPRAIGLTVFMALAELGSSGLAEMMDGQAQIGDRLRILLREVLLRTWLTWPLSS
jgi:hypothetical protein